MGKTSSSKNTNSTKAQLKNKSDPTTIKSSSLSSIQRKGSPGSNSTRQMTMAVVRDKENIVHHTRLSNDINDDERMESQTFTHTVPRRMSAVHEYATKISPNEYQCKLCSKVHILLI
jgi:hypothetical protein